MRFFRPWLIIRWLYSDALFRIGTNDRIFCLTFDDGPDPASTPGLLDLLDSYNIKAMFFCTGQAAEDYPHLMDEIRKRGHLTGNHGYSHCDGWKTSFREYLDNIFSASDLTSDKFFRPPYGRLTIKQYKHLRKSFRIILWDIMLYDFDGSLDPSESFKILKNKLRPGSLIVLHDTKDFSLEITGRLLDYAASKGYRYVLPS
jgi:peptidoglycan/xylan/chitin deacetylase (PgdA/CDA1 family)